MARIAHLRIVETARNLVAVLPRVLNSRPSSSEVNASSRASLGPTERYARGKQPDPTFQPPQFVDKWKVERAAAALDQTQQTPQFLRLLTLLSIVATALAFSVVMLWIIVGAVRVNTPSARTAATTSPNVVATDGPSKYSASAQLSGSSAAQSRQHLGSATSSQAPPRQDAQPKMLVPVALSLPAGATRTLDISVDLSDRSSTALIILSGVPTGTRFSAGYSLASDRWSVGVSELAGLSMTVPATSSGRYDMVVELLSREGVLLALGRTLLTIEVPSRSTANSKRLLELGKRQFQEGQVAIARLYFQRAVDGGDGEAARLLGDTFVPAKLTAIGAIGVNGDVRIAAYWYRRADELGDPHAKALLAATER